MTKIIGLLSFFDEEPALLYESVSRVCALGVEHVLAMDGPYALYPYDKVSSGPECKAAIVDACEAHGATYWVVDPHKAWEGNEVEKRNAMLFAAMAPVTGVPSIAEHVEDWFLVFDADHMWSKIAPEWVDLGHLLDLTPHDVAEVAFGEDRDHPYEARLLNRVIHGMQYERAHWRIRYLNGRSSATLRAGDASDQVEVLDLTDSFSVWHAVYEQPEERRLRQGVYYRYRDGGKHES